MRCNVCGAKRHCVDGVEDEEYTQRDYQYGVDIMSEAEA
eukprot:COSAG06_NODE_33679_length_486_cov_0.542636_2_plen_38_part_01